MTERQRATRPANTVRIAVAGVIIAGGALGMAGQAAADPALPYPTPAPPGPAEATPAPGEPVASSDGLVGPPPPPPVGPPTVPEIQDPVYGAGQTPGKLGYLRDIWHTFHSGNPLDALTAPQEVAPGPPPGAGSPPQLPPGYISMNAPESNGPPRSRACPGRAAAAARVLPVERATAARVLRLSGAARPGRTTDDCAGSANALTAWAALVLLTSRRYTGPLPSIDASLFENPYKTALSTVAAKAATVPMMCDSIAARATRGFSDTMAVLITSWSWFR